MNNVTYDEHEYHNEKKALTTKIEVLTIHSTYVVHVIQVVAREGHLIDLILKNTTMPVREPTTLLISRINCKPAALPANEAFF